MEESITTAGKAIAASLTVIEQAMEAAKNGTLLHSRLAQAHYEMTVALLHARVCYKLSVPRPGEPQPSQKPPHKKGKGK